MRCAALSVLALLLVVASSGCHSFDRGASQGEGPYACGDGCQVDGPYDYSDESVACQTGGDYACTDGSCGHGGRARGLLQAVGQAFRRHHDPQPPVGGPPVATVTYPYYTVRGPRDFLANDPPSIGPY